MLKLIEGSIASFFPKEIDAMYRNRAEPFRAGSAGKSWSRTAMSETVSTTRIRCISYPSIRTPKSTGDR